MNGIAVQISELFEALCIYAKSQGSMSKKYEFLVCKLAQSFRILSYTIKATQINLPSLIKCLHLFLLNQSVLTQNFSLINDQNDSTDSNDDCIIDT